MPLQYDATLKDLVSRHWADFAALLRLEGPAPAHVLNVDLSTVSAATDFAVGFGDPVQWIADLNFQAQAWSDVANRVFVRYLIDGHIDATDQAATLSASAADTTVDFLDQVHDPGPQPLPI